MNSSPANPARYYVVVRTDLSLAQQMVQVAHACVTAGARHPLPTYHHLLLFGVPSQEALQAVEERLRWEDITSHLFFEPDDDMGYTALCTEPLYGPRPKLFAKLALWSPVVD